MNRKLPSFPSLRAFEAAARHLSFKMAAEELCLTQSAISHQVKALEEFLGAPLFIRHPQRVELTLRGLEYYEMVNHLLDGIESATRKMRGNRIEGALFVQASPSFTSYWLLPRLIRFNRRYPDVEVNLSTIASPDMSANHPFDLRVNCAWEVPPDHGGEPLMQSIHVPVCVPELLADGPEVKVVKDVFKYPIVKTVPAWDAWSRWLSKVGAGKMPQVSGPLMENIYMALQAAEAGQGIAMAPVALIQEKIALGKLVVALDLPAHVALYFTLSCADNWQHNSKILAFREWMNQELGSSSGMDMTYVSANTSGN